ncbi:uncharacterized protein AMSG_10768 [Thecamonas trahens ATCC 50062]|uniref:PH domain-containing protein n=1 Tax=Thecamonas trahens ATCC 50062 TaxID=461836 RepID=A0A0L0DS55_THETB|nr:hypothetical protein AMSG_10768 [Thecamonas trahens ATCC 50062]KNC55159.1 hypothetical protein AMSG_10768 [Thecamonas trahens ATCC 50062]|eukprot:XP_013753214.1 hypothetical protein AMSG_10768 [Thecamonas trahens ATCC 50062]
MPSDASIYAPLASRDALLARKLALKSTIRSLKADGAPEPAVQRAFEEYMTVKLAIEALEAQPLSSAPSAASAQTAAAAAASSTDSPPVDHVDDANSSSSDDPQSDDPQSGNNADELEPELDDLDDLLPASSSSFAAIDPAALTGPSAVASAAPAASTSPVPSPSSSPSRRKRKPRSQREKMLGTIYALGAELAPYQGPLLVRSKALFGGPSLAERHCVVGADAFVIYRSADHRKVVASIPLRGALFVPKTRKTALGFKLYSRGKYHRFLLPEASATNNRLATWGAAIVTAIDAHAVDIADSLTLPHPPVAASGVVHAVGWLKVRQQKHWLWRFAVLTDDSFSFTEEAVLDSSALAVVSDMLLAGHGRRSRPPTRTFRLSESQLVAISAPKFGEKYVFALASPRGHSMYIAFPTSARRSFWRHLVEPAIVDATIRRVARSDLRIRAEVRPDAAADAATEDSDQPASSTSSPLATSTWLDGSTSIFATQGLAIALVFSPLGIRVRPADKPAVIDSLADPSAGAGTAPVTTATELPALIPYAALGDVLLGSSHAPPSADPPPAPVAISVRDATTGTMCELWLKSPSAWLLENIVHNIRLYFARPAQVTP